MLKIFKDQRGIGQMLMLGGVAVVLAASGLAVYQYDAHKVPASHAAGCTYIDNNLTQSEITGNGVNNPVTITRNGNCFHITHSGTWHTYTWDMWQNSSGHCLWSNGPNLEVGGPCANDNNHPNEEFFGFNHNDNGWTWSNVTNFESGGGAFFAPTSCNVNSRVTLQVYSACPRWHFLTP
jgi:hypothetical protein